MPGPGPGGLRWLAPEEEGPRGLHGPEVETVLVRAEGPHTLLVPPPQREWGRPHTPPLWGSECRGGRWTQPCLPCRMRRLRVSSTWPATTWRARGSRKRNSEWAPRCQRGPRGAEDAEDGGSGLAPVPGEPQQHGQPPACPSPSVFQLSHEKYKPFIFAAETLADLSM